MMCIFLKIEVISNNKLDLFDFGGDQK